ncbi:hypothetical protein C8A01DRAFT_42459 [Parachaetomium inaequale]|uniref:Uncharacterized protein n=1 Tax=Parachaetomium inaequale TaxID=2588326 RepID=A0AAN6PRD5_9PEZI|nr:hypothetical protein C8A01DRAFT_42459 [Parachaetomium inaequale]
MAPAAIPQPHPSSRRASTHTNGSGHDRAAALTPTRQTARSTSPPPTVRTDLTRLKIAHREAGQSPLPGPWHPDPFCEAGGVRSPVDRKNTGDSTVPSKEHSVAWSQEDSDASSDDDGYYSPPVALRRFDPVPPPQPLPPRDATRFLPPPPWHPAVGPVSARPPIQSVRALDSAYSESESNSESEEDSDDEATRSLPGEGGRRNELQEMIEAKQRSIRQLRHQMAGKRKELREFRHRKDNIDNALMQIFRPHLASKSGVAMIPVDVLEARLGEMQAIRDDYYVAEVAYEAMESELDAEEATLEMLEVRTSRFAPVLADVVPKVELPPPPPTMRAPGIVQAKEQDDSCDEDDSAPPTPVTLLGISGDLYEDVHPLYAELLEVAGDRQLAKEHAEDLEMHREKILYDLEIELHRKRVREDQGNQISEEDLLSLRSSLAKVPTDAAEFEHRFGITITEDELEFLRDYDPVFEHAREELDATTEALSHLRALCLKKGVMRKHASYHEEVAIFSSAPDWSPSPHDGNMAIEPPPRPPPSHNNNDHPATTPPSLAHPRFPILLSNPSHVLSLLTPLQALERALRLPKDDPSGALRRAECMKELGIGTLMTKAANKPDYINQWLIHRLRTSALEAELMLAVCEGVFKVVNLRRWQEEVLYYWRLDEAANVEVGLFEGGGGGGGGGDVYRGGQPPPQPLGFSGGGGLGGARLHLHIAGGDGGPGSVGGEANSVIEGEGRVRSDGGEGVVSPGVRERARSVRSLG